MLRPTASRAQRQQAPEETTTMTDAELERALAAVDLPRPAYWQAQYLKNVEQLSKPQYRMVIERDVAVPMRDGVVLRADVFRPDAPGQFPGLLALSAYGKDSQSAPIPAQPIHSWVFDHNVEAGDIAFFVSRG
jgi:predicted acyl esterase